MAELVVGGKRHLGLADALIKGRRLAWPSPIGDAMPEIEKHRGRPVAVLASGDPFHYGVGDMLMRSIPAGRDALPAASRRPSAWRPRGSAGRCRTWRRSACMAARWKASCAICSPARASSLCRGTARRRPSWRSCWSSAGLGASSITVLEAMGGPRERVRQADGRRTSISARSRRSTPSRWRSSAPPMRPCSALAPGLDDSAVRA